MSNFHFSKRALPMAASWSRRLSTEQQRFYFLHEMNPSDPGIYINRVLRIAGDLDGEILRDSVLDMARRHEVLRSYFPTINGQLHIALRDSVESAVSMINLSLLAPSERAQKVDELVANEMCIREPLSIDDGPLFRVTIIKVAHDEHVLVVRFHHIIIDGSSVRLFLRGLLETYRSLAHGKWLERPSHQFRDFIAWEAGKLTDKKRQKCNAYWAKKLSHPTPLDLAIGKERPKRHSKEAGTVHIVAGHQLRESLKATCQAKHVTAYTVMLSVMHLLLHKLTGEQDTLIGTPIAYRQRREFQSMLGVFVNWIASRAKIAPQMTFMELLLHIRTDIPHAYVHQSSYKSLLSAAGDIPRDPSRNPLFQVVLNYVNYEPLPEPEGLSVALDPIESTQTHYDLSARFEEIGDRWSLALTYYKGALEHDEVEALGEAFFELVEYCLEHPHCGIADVPIPAYLRTASSRRAQAPRSLPPETSATTSRKTTAAQEESSARARQRIVVSSTFTAEPVQPIVDYWLEQVNLPADIHFTGFNQVFQELLNPEGLLAQNTLGVNILLIRFEDWKDPAHAVEEFSQLLASHGQRSSAHTIVVVCPPTADRRSGDAAATHDGLAQQIVDIAASSSRIHVLSWKTILSLYPVAEIDDVESDRYAKAPYTADFNVALGTAIARKVHAALCPSPKVLVLDCDNTIWRGIVGEDGPHGIAIDEGRRALQQFAIEQLNAGVLLCLASKNNEADVWEAFETVPHMPLRRDMIVAHRINWEPKSKNLMSLAQELNLGLDSFVFVDDSPTECAEVRAACPSVLVYQIPTESEHISRFIKHLWPLDQRKVTDTDRKRAQMYAANAQREQLRSHMPDLSEFVASLAVKTSFIPPSAKTLARVSQLTRRTNQFNSTTIRRSEAEIEQLQQSNDWELLIADVSDRFGDYGIVGVVICRYGTRALEVDSFLLSCRALGRGVEQTILAELGRMAEARGCARVDIEYRRTAKNQPIYQFLQAIAKEHCVALDTEDHLVYQIPVAEAQAAPDTPITTTSCESNKGVQVAAPASTGASHDVWRQIATELNAVGAIAKHISAARMRTRNTEHVFVAPRNELESLIAQIWCDTLLLQQVGINDDYFGVGGDSIRSLAVVSAMRQAGLSVSVLDIHEHPTIEQLAEVLGQRDSRTAQDSAPMPTADEVPFHKGLYDKGPYPLSFSQQYIIQTYARENLQTSGAPSGAFHIQDRLLVQEKQRPHSMTALRQAVDLVVRHTTMVRTRVFQDADGWKQVELPVYPDALDVVDVTGLKPKAQEARIDALLSRDRMRPFDPERSHSPMIRLYAIVKSAMAFELIVTAHHGFCDGWSLQAFYNHLFALYQAYKDDDDAAIDELERQLAADEYGFRELVYREQQALSLQRQEAFWRTYLPTRLPKRPRIRRTNGRQQTLIAHRDGRFVERAHQRARASRTSLKAVLLDSFATALARVLDTHSPLAIGVITNGRKDDLQRPMDVFGLCWTVVPIVVDAGAAEQARLHNVHRDLISTEAHARYPVKEMFGGSDPADVVRASFNLTNFHNSRWKRGTEQLHIAKAESFHRFHFPIDFNIRLDGRSRHRTDNGADRGSSAVVLKLNWLGDAFVGTFAHKLIEEFCAIVNLSDQPRHTEDA